MSLSYVIAALLACFVLALFCWYRHQRLLKERAQIMRDAIRHRDFSFHLPTRGLFFGEKALQEALNDLGSEMQRLLARGEVESWQRLTRVLTHEIMNAATPIQSISQAYLNSPDIEGSPFEEGIRAIHDTSTGLTSFIDNYRKLTQLQEPVLSDINVLSFAESLASLYPQLRWHIDIPAEYGFVKVVQTFDDPEATSEIVYTSSAETVTYVGYTHISRVGYSPWMEDTLSLALDKGGE